MKTIKPLAALLLALTLVLGLAGCGQSAEDTATSLIQGNLDVIYLNKVSAEYTKLTGASQAECTETYEEGLEVEAKVFLYYFDVEYPTDEYIQRVIEFYDKVYAHSNFTVEPAVEQSKDSYTSTVTIRPINIFELVVDNADEALEEFNARYADVDFETITEEDYIAYDQDYAEVILALCESQLANLGYMDEETVTVEVARDSDGYLVMTEESLQAVDNLIIYYPN